MQDQSDAQLLRAYVESGQETAFREIVTRHTDLVYCAALRQVNSPDLARDLAQSVFTDLARKARPLAEKLGEASSLVGWLYRSTRFAALKHLRDNHRRLTHERQAMEQLIINSETAPDWEQVRPVLDQSMADLNDEDREAVLLRYFKNCDFQTVGRALGISDAAAQKRVSRALDKLRELLLRRGITTTGATLSVAIAANAVQAAPAGLAATLSTTAIAGTTLTATSLTVTKAITMTTLQKTLIGAAIAAAVGTGIYEARQASIAQAEAEGIRQRQGPLNDQIQQMSRERDEATNQVAALREEVGRLTSNNTDLLKLRREVAKLQRAQNDSNQPDFKGKLGVIYYLKRRSMEMRDKSIPEIEYLDDDDWLRLAQRPGFDGTTETEESIRRALADVRREAKVRFAARIQRALQSFTKDHQGELPPDMQQLQSYLNAQPDPQAFTRIRYGLDGFSRASRMEPQNLPPVDDATLQRYEVVQTGNVSSLRPTQYVIREKAPVDSQFDSLIQIGLGGFFTFGVGKLQNQIGWSGEPDLAGLTPEQRQAYQQNLEARERMQTPGPIRASVDK